MFKKFIITLCVLLLVPINCFALEKEEISAECAVVIDAYSKQVLFEKNAYLKHSMASTTKLMTCLIACESNKLSDEVIVTDAMLNGVEGTSIYLKSGDKISLLDLVKGALLESGNDAANTIAFYLGGSLEGFTAIMNKRAKEIGMYNTNFVTPSGLDADLHYSSAYDMALLAAFCCDNKTLVGISASKSGTVNISGNERILFNHNKLLARSNHFFGFKTGFTKKSGRCLVSAFDYGSSKIICVTLNAPDDWNDHIKLVRNAKKRYNSTNKKISLTINAVGSNKQYVNCSYSYNVKTLGEVWAKRYYYPFVYAPVKAGDIIGYAELYVGDKHIKTVDILSDEDLNNG